MRISFSTTNHIGPGVQTTIKTMVGFITAAMVCLRIVIQIVPQGHSFWGQETGERWLTSISRIAPKVGHHFRRNSRAFIGGKEASREDGKAPGEPSGKSQQRLRWVKKCRSEPQQLGTALCGKALGVPSLDCYWVGSLDFNLLENKGVFH